MAEQVAKYAEIKIRVGMNAAQMPVEMEWSASDQPGAEAQPCKAMLLSLFDAKSKETLKIDLWTQEFQVVEMDRFMYNTLRALADTYHKATQNAQLAADMQRFVQYFGEKTEILPNT